MKLANRGLTLSPNDLDLLDTRGTIQSNIDDRLEAAKADFEKCVELSPSDSRQKAQAFLKLGRICVKLNELAPARKSFKNALEIDQKINIFTPEEKSEIDRLLNGIVAQN